MDTIRDSDIGRKVVYTPFKGCTQALREEGVITSYNAAYVFVRYGSDLNSKATIIDAICLIGSK